MFVWGVQYAKLYNVYSVHGLKPGGKTHRPYFTEEGKPHLRVSI